MKFGEKLYKKIEICLIRGNVSKAKVAKALGVTPTTLSRQFKTLKEEDHISTVTLKKIEELTGEKIFIL